MAGTPAVPGAINVVSLTGSEIVELHPFGQNRSQTTTQNIANLGTPGASSIQKLTYTGAASGLLGILPAHAVVTQVVFVNLTGVDGTGSVGTTIGGNEIVDFTTVLANTDQSTVAVLTNPFQVNTAIYAGVSSTTMTVTIWFFQ
jgi:hypothetical protein